MQPRKPWVNKISLILIKREKLQRMKMQQQHSYRSFSFMLELSNVDNVANENICFSFSVFTWMSDNRNKRCRHAVFWLLCTNLKKMTWETISPCHLCHKSAVCRQSYLQYTYLDLPINSTHRYAAMNNRFIRQVQSVDRKDSTIQSLH